MSKHLLKLIMWKKTSLAEVTTRAKTERLTSGEREKVDSLMFLKT